MVINDILILSFTYSPTLRSSNNVLTTSFATDGFNLLVSSYLGFYLYALMITRNSLHMAAISMQAFPHFFYFLSYFHKHFLSYSYEYLIKSTR
jgi:hypothetical protein